MQPEPPEHDLRGEPEGTSLDWLLGLLKAAITGVMESDSPPLRKANAVARLGGLYLKADGAAELKRANTLLRKRLAEMEQRLAALETPDRDAEAGGESSPGEAVPRSHPGGRVENGRSEAKKRGSEAAREKNPGRSPGDPIVQMPAGQQEAAHLAPGTGRAATGDPSSSPGGPAACRSSAPAAGAASAPGPRGETPPRHRPGRSGKSRRR